MGEFITGEYSAYAQRAAKRGADYSGGSGCGHAGEASQVTTMQVLPASRKNFPHQLADPTLMNLGNFSVPLATLAGHRLTCLPSCHCSMRPVIVPSPILRACG